MRRETLSTVTKASRVFQWVHTVAYGMLIPLILASLLASIWLPTGTSVTIGLATLVVGIVSSVICTVEVVSARRMRPDTGH